MQNYKDFSKKEYAEIGRGELQPGDIFVCRNGNKQDMFKFLVGIEREGDCELLGMFPVEYLGRISASIMSSLKHAIDTKTKDGLTGKNTLGANEEDILGFSNLFNSTVN